MFRGLSARLAGADLSLREDTFQEGVAAVLAALERFDVTSGYDEHFTARSARGRLLDYRRSLRHRVGITTRSANHVVHVWID
jgi:DNA-directed RNA polymerase specialized sigma subunit